MNLKWTQRLLVDAKNHPNPISDDLNSYEMTFGCRIEAAATITDF